MVGDKVVKEPLLLLYGLTLLLVFKLDDIRKRMMQITITSKAMKATTPPTIPMIDHSRAIIIYEIEIF